MFRFPAPARFSVSLTNGWISGVPAALAYRVIIRMFCAPAFTGLSALLTKI
jgi:hypothetical protein